MSRVTVAVATALAGLLLVSAVILVSRARNGPEAASGSSLDPSPSEPTGTPIDPAAEDPESGREVIEDPTPDLPVALEQITFPWTTDWSRRTIELDELKIGIQTFDPRDRIRPLDSPRYEAIESAEEWLIDREIGIMLELDETARFYPLRILTSHEVVNDEFGDLPFVVTYCPLCNTAVAFDRRVGDEVLRFGVSGLLRNSDLVMWDSLTDSLWQQITGEGIVGAYAGAQLDLIPTSTVTWADFKTQHPSGEALSQDTGFGFNYGTNGYVGYSDRGAPFGRFFDAELDERFPALERVVGVRAGDTAKAYPFSVIEPVRTVNDIVGEIPIAVWWGESDAADNFSGAVAGGGESIGTGIAFVREVDGDVLSFDPLGPVTFTDLETGSTWNLLGTAIEGPLAGAQLETALHQNEFWFAWSTFNEGAPVYLG